MGTTVRGLLAGRIVLLPALVMLSLGAAREVTGQPSPTGEAVMAVAAASGGPASESGTLRHGDGTHGRSDRCKRSFVLPILNKHPPYPRQHLSIAWIALAINAITMSAVIYYACVARNQWIATLDQLKVMRQAQRPWVGVSQELDLTARTRRFPNAVGPNILLEGVYRVKNFGTSPAFAVNSHIGMYVSVSTDAGRPSEQVAPVGPLCMIRDTQQGFGEVIFPGGETSFDTGDQISFRDKDQHRFLWVIGCITYLDADRNLHHTRFWLRTAIPISSFSSWGQEAD